MSYRENRSDEETTLDDERAKTGERRGKKIGKSIKTSEGKRKKMVVNNREEESSTEERDQSRGKKMILERRLGHKRVEGWQQMRGAYEGRERRVKQDANNTSITSWGPYLWSTHTHGNVYLEDEL